VTPYLIVDGVRITPASITATELGFCLRLPAQEIRLISGSAPSNRPSDDRLLGVLLRRLRWERDGETMDVPVDSPSFVDGFHHVEIHDPKAGPVRWTTGDAALPPTLFPPWSSAVQLRLTLADWRARAQEIVVSAEAALLGGFESLGQDCEFGLVQRRYLVEPPLSLLRWGGAPLENLIEGLDSNFAGLTEPENTELIWGQNEYFVRTPYVTIHTHCIVEQNEAGQAEVLRSGRATLRILRRKFLKDIADARRIFVFKSTEPPFGESEMRRLHAALNRIGPAALLCVTWARSGQAPGGVERIGNGLYAAHVGRFFLDDDGPIDQWIPICAETKALHDGGRVKVGFHVDT
jgi:hypothetical protein